MTALSEVEEVINGLIRKETINAKVYRDIASGHYKKAAKLFGEAANASDPDGGNDADEGDRLTRQAEKEDAAGDAAMKKAFAEDAKIKGKQECLDAIRKKWRAGKSIPSPR